jgi:uncharacterized protein (TIGR02646 family)
MIRLKRSRKKADVPIELLGEKRREKELELLRHAAGGGDFDTEFWKSKGRQWKPAREQLFKETEWKCAYCESIKEKSREGAVEHFRPKSTYWWLAYCYENYLFACTICNSEWKGDHFPVDGVRLCGPACKPAMSATALEKLAGSCTPDPLGRGDGLSVKEFRIACRSERPRLLDPYVVDPEPFFKWLPVAAGTLSDGRPRWDVEAGPRNNRPQTVRVFEAARDYYGINRAELKDLRGRVYAILLDYRKTVDAIDPVTHPRARAIAEEGLRKLTSARCPYAGMARYFVHDEWRLLRRK